MKNVIDRIHDQNFKKLILTGGEFFAIPYWKDVLTYSKEKGFSIRLITNASLIKPADIPFLENHVERINVSFHSANKKMYNEIMGISNRDTFEKVIQNLHLGNSKIETGIFFSPLRTNFHSLFDTVKFLSGFGIKLSHVNLNRIIPTQHTRDYFDDHAPLSYFEHKVLIEQIVKINRELQIPASAEAYPVCFLDKIIEDKESIKQINQPCFLGRKAIAFNNDGTLKLCPATGFSVEEKTLETFGSAAWRHPACKTCPSWELCLGGCHASGGTAYGDDSLIIDDEIQFQEGIDPAFFDLLINLYKPFLGTTFKKAPVQYTVRSKHKYPHPIGFIAVNHSPVNADFLEIALVPGLKEKYYSFLALQKLFQTLPVQKYGWTVHKANLPSIKLLEKLGGGFYEKTVKNKKRIQAEGFFRVNGSQPVSQTMRNALKELLPQAEEQFASWQNEFNSRNLEKKALYNYLEGFKP